MTDYQYKNFAQLGTEIAESTKAIESGNTTIEEIEILLDSVRALHEKLLVFQYKLGEKMMANNTEKPIDMTETKEPERPEPEDDPPEDEPLFDLTETDNKDEIMETEQQETPMDAKQVSLIDAIASANSEDTINEKLGAKIGSDTLANRMEKTPISDLLKEISLNRKFQFINDLFGGNSEAYNKAVTKLNAIAKKSDAEAYLDELGTEYNWEQEEKSVQNFYELTERKFA